MYIYHYHPITKEFLLRTNALIDPMATKHCGAPVYLCPANGTDIPPPYTATPEKYRFIWNENIRYWDAVERPEPLPVLDPIAEMTEEIQKVEITDQNADGKPV